MINNYSNNYSNIIHDNCLKLLNIITYVAIETTDLLLNVYESYIIT